MKTFDEHVHDCLDNTAATVRSWRKAHTEGPQMITAVVEAMTVGYPPWPDRRTVPGTEEWAQHLLRAMSPDDAKAITDLVAVGLVPYPSLWRARTHYARVCHERHWSGQAARAAWAILEALLKDDIDDDIPF